MAIHYPAIRAERPFSHIIAFEWYDGPVNGLARVADAEDACVFTMLDWDQRQETRVFALFKSDLTNYNDCLRTLSTAEAPRRPVWHPMVEPGRFDFSEWLRCERERLFAVVGASRYLDEILVYRTVSAGETIDLTEWDPDRERGTHDWIGELLGVNASLRP